MTKLPARPSLLAHERARDLRNSSTDCERKLWAHLRGKRLVGAKFRRQHPIGPYIVDFFCREAKLIVELDGGGHDTVERRGYDAARTVYLESRGYKVLRFWNNDIIANLEGVIVKIRDSIT